jgi:hypothetical protein
MNDQEVAAILADTSKRIEGDLEWVEPTPGCAWVKFSAVVENDEGRPLQVSGSYGRLNKKISINLLHPSLKGRLYGLDIGGAHAFPDLER